MIIMATKPKNDTLGDRMKSLYEDRTRFMLPRRTYTILRVDGRAFHTWTRGLSKPYDKDFMSCIDGAALALCEEIAGTRFAFVQSDEISLLATDFDTVESQPWFDGNIQKWASVASGIAGAAFNARVADFMLSAKSSKLGSTKKPNAVFDARVFTIPDYIEVENYFIWRQRDAERNSLTLLASAYASHKELHGKSASDRHEIIHAAGDNWAKHPAGFKRGRIIRRNCEFETNLSNQGRWHVDAETPVFTRNRSYLRKMIPRHWAGDDKEELDNV
jgi:tRNA(His) 5'-end guanylyltransferase